MTTALDLNKISLQRAMPLSAVRTMINPQGFKATLLGLFGVSLFAVAPSALAHCPPLQPPQNFDLIRAPVLPAGCTASQGTNVTGAPLWVTSNVTPYNPPNDAFSTAPDGILDNRLDVLVYASPFDSFLTFQNSFNLQSGRDGAVLEVSHPNINGGAFIDITDPAINGSISPGYNSIISSAFQSPIAGRMAWSGNSGGYATTFVGLGNAAFTPPFPSEVKLRFRMVSDNSGSSEGWRIDSIVFVHNECPSPTPTVTASPTATATATPIATPCGSPNVIADSTFEAGTPWNNWTVQTSTNFGTPLCNIDACGTSGGTAPPYAGDNWAWFGGAPLAETATIGQNVLMMAGGQPTLNFLLRIGAVSSPYTDVLNLKVDGSIVQSYPEPNQAEIGYTLRTIDLSAFADGTTHLIVFEYIGSTMGTSNYVVDNVTLATGPACSSPSPTATATATATASPTPARSLNLSTRMLVQTGDQVGIGGFIITGSAPEEVLLRAIGPSLAAAGVPNPLADPVMELHGPTGFTTITNDNWRDTQEAQIIATGLAPTDQLESAILATLDPGPYTAIVRGKNDTSGVGLVEVYDLGQASSQLANISTRAFVDTGTDVLIGGFILGGDTGTATILLRGLGPSLTGIGLSGVLADPTLELRDNNGALLASNDNCGDSPPGPPFPPFPAPTNPLEACIGVTLPPGLFTTILAGRDGGTGIGLVEIYNLN